MSNMYVSPWLRSPLTDLTGSLISNQWYGKCAETELKALECLEAYGLDKGLKVCDLLLKDFKECTLKNKQLKRVEAMEYERERQYRAGERTKENRYADPPNPTAF